MLAMADKNGDVIASVPGLADMARVPLGATVNALDRLAAPDEWSSSKEFEGRRIERIDRGWKLLNHAKFRAIRDEENRRGYMSEYMRDYRKHPVNTVNSRKPRKPKLAQADTDTEADTEAFKPKSSVREHYSRPSLGEVTAYCQERGKGVDPQQWFDFYTSNGWRVGRNSMKNWRAAVRTWERNGFGTKEAKKSTVAERNQRAFEEMERRTQQDHAPVLKNS